MSVAMNPLTSTLHTVTALPVSVCDTVRSYLETDEEAVNRYFMESRDFADLTL